MGIKKVTLGDDTAPQSRLRIDGPGHLDDFGVRGPAQHIDVTTDAYVYFAVVPNGEPRATILGQAVGGEADLHLLAVAMIRTMREAGLFSAAMLCTVLGVHDRPDGVCPIRDEA